MFNKLFKSISHIAADMITFHITQIIAKCGIINIWQYHIYCFVHIHFKASLCCKIREYPTLCKDF